MNLSNQLTMARIFLAAVFLWLLLSEFPGSAAAALVIFLLASATDYWDGEIARRRDQITAFGKLMDPIADKVLTLCAFLGFVQMNLVPAWMVVAIIARDLLITGLRLGLPSQSEGVAARKSGKQKTVVQFIAIIAVLFFLVCRGFGWWNPAWTHQALRMIYWGIFFVVLITVSSGARYLAANRELWMGQRTDDAGKF